MTVRVLALLFSVLFCWQISAACTCASPSPQPCSGLKATGVVFVGTVVDIKNPPPDDGGLGGPGLSTYHFRVDENIAGLEGRQEVDVYSGRGGADCSYHFQNGERYLVFPYRDGSQLTATICSYTRPIAAAEVILPQLRAMRDRQRVASVYGILKSSQQPYEWASDDSPDHPLANTRLELRSGNKTFSTITDANGIYAFYNVPKGEYRFTGELPEHLELAQKMVGGPPHPLKLPANACFEFDLSALPSGHIRGRVEGPGGKPLDFADVELFRPQKYTEPGGWDEAQDRDNGLYFEFQNVAPGDYVLVYNNMGTMDADVPYPRTFYGDVSDLHDAKTIHLEAGQKLDDVVIRVSGGLPTRQLLVRLVAEQGGLPDVSFVEGRGSDGKTTTEQEVSAGVFSISILKNLTYDFYGQGYCSATNKEMTTDSAQVDGSEDRTTEVVLTFHGKGCRRQPADDPK